jgi:hypothetical protein
VQGVDGAVAFLSARGRSLSKGKDCAREKECKTKGEARSGFLLALLQVYLSEALSLVVVVASV